MSARGRAALRRVPPFLGLSLLGHLVIVAVLTLTGAVQSCLVAPEPSDEGLTFVTLGDGPVDITLIEPRPLNPFATPLDETEQAKAMETKLEQARKEEEVDDGQVVDIPRPEVEMRPDDDTPFRALYDSKVDKETAGPSGRGDGSARPAIKSGGSADRGVVSPHPPAPDRGKGKGTLAMRGGEEGKNGNDQPLSGAPRDQSGFRPYGQQGELPEAVSGQGGEDAQQSGTGRSGRPGSDEVDGAPSMDDLRPSEDVVKDVVGAGSSDYLKDVDDGEETLLNTKRFKYATFFGRVKKAVAQNWHPDTAYRLRDPTGQIYGQKNRLTVLKVSIHPDGRIRDILIEKPCGVDFLDDEAVSAFHAAEPFPNPPGGLVDPDSHLITFRFGFFFEITSSPSFKIFRYGN